MVMMTPTSDRVLVVFDKNTISLFVGVIAMLGMMLLLMNAMAM
jgi:hypothetical protein